MSKSLFETPLIDTLPSSIKDDGSVALAANALDPQFVAVADALDRPAIHALIDSMTSEQLDHLARQYDATWRDTWSVTLKRNMLKTTIATKQLVGTIHAVREALSVISSIAQITEWWQTTPKGTPHTFLITVTPSDISGGISADLQADIISQIDFAKPARSLYTLQIQEGLKGTVNCCGVLRAVTTARISHLK